jgi:hypothetical protein
VITTTARVTAPEAGPRRLTSALLWAAQILLAAFFLLVAALPKLIGDHSAVQEFGAIGAASGSATSSEQSNWPGRSACLRPGSPGWRPPGSPPTWPARPSSMPRCCTTQHTAPTSG